MASRAPSQSLARAAASELDRIERMLGVLSQRRAVLEAQLGEIEVEASELHDRQRLLRLLVPEQAEAEGSAADSPVVRSPRALKGRALRRLAGRLLWESHAGNEIHYREWFERVLTAGYAVGGKEPAAAFLTNVRDSPAVARGSRAGYYRLDPSSRDRLEQALREAHAELADVTQLLDSSRHPGASLDHVDRLREHRDTLTQRIRKLELDAGELDAIFGRDSETGDLADSHRRDSLLAA